MVTLLLPTSGSASVLGHDVVRAAQEVRRHISMVTGGKTSGSIFLAAGREAWHLANLLQEPIYLVSGFYFPVKSLGFWAANFASLVPLTLGLDARRQLLFTKRR